MENSINLTMQSKQFYEAVCNAIQYLQQKNIADPLEQGSITFRSSSSPQFPADEVQSIDIQEKSISIISTHNGLTGTTSPLPSYFSEEVFKAEDTDSFLKDFLGIFEQRLYTLLFKAMYMHDPLHSLLSKDIQQSIQSFCGVDSCQEKENGLVYAKHLLGNIRSAEALEGYIKSVFSIPAKVNQWVSCYIDIGNSEPLGKGAQLGTVYLGNTEVDAANTFSITLGPLTKNEVSNFLPGTSKHTALVNRIKKFIHRPMDFELQVTMKKKECGKCNLGANHNALGIFSILGDCKDRDIVSLKI
jgi:type VI secretion system protein ImpH